MVTPWTLAQFRRWLQERQRMSIAQEADSRGLIEFARRDVAQFDPVLAQHMVDMAEASLRCVQHVRHRAEEDARKKDPQG